MDHGFSFELVWYLCDVKERIRIENPQVGNLVLCVMPGIGILVIGV